MKYLIVLVVVLVVFWYWRRASRGDAPAKPAPQQAPTKQQDMVQCPVCLVHLPRGDALPGPDGKLYCCAEHRGHADG